MSGFIWGTFGADYGKIRLCLNKRKVNEKQHLMLIRGVAFLFANFACVDEIRGVC